MADPCHFYIGATLGSNSQTTALAIVERVYARRDEDEGGHPIDVHLKEQEIPYRVVHLERLPKGMPRPQQAAVIRSRMTGISTWGRGPQGRRSRAQVVLIVDRTGVGAASLETMEHAGMEPFTLFIHGADKVIQEGRDYRVPRRDLVTLLTVLQEQERLKVSPELPAGDVLIREMRSFSYTVSKTARDDVADWREGTTDDLLFAVAVAVWGAKQELLNFEPMDRALSHRLATYRGI